MKFLATVLVSFLASAAAFGQSETQRAWELEKKGDAAGALALLEQDAHSAGATPDSLLALAQFLDRHNDPNARRAYSDALRLADAEDTRRILHRLVVLDLLAGDQPAFHKDLAAYRRAGGSDLNLPATPPAAPEASAPGATTLVPGPLRSFARMAALSPDLNRDQLLPALARNIVTNGYQAASSNEALEQTEYLKLIVRYLSQARELQALAGKDREIRIDTCDSTQTADLLKVLGYRLRGACGSDLALETVNASRAFLTTDSGFPLAGLEQDLRTNRPFHYAYAPTEIPVLYGTKYWMPSGETPGSAFIDYFISDPSLCRLYLGLAKLDPSTAAELRRAIALPRLRAYAHVLDFFGGMFEIRNGVAVVPGGERCARVWADLAGAPPSNPTSFFDHLLARDDGWLASYYDSLSRISGPSLDYLTEPARMKRFYEAVRGKVTSPGPARPVFRSNTEMILLTSRLWVLPDGKPFIPGDLDVWRRLFIRHPHGKYDSKLSKAASNWKQPDDVVEALFGLCRKSVENEPLKIFLALTDIERRRANPLDAHTVDVLARHYHDFGAQYSVFSEVPQLSPATMVKYLDVAADVESLRDPGIRADAGGSLQGLIGLWLILYRQGQIHPAAADKTLAGLLDAFSNIGSERDIFDAGRAGVKTLLATSHGAASGEPQERLTDLLAGASEGVDADVQTALQETLMRVFEAQRLISLDTLFSLADSFDGAAKGRKPDTQLVARAAARISEIQLPRAALSAAERNTMAYGYWSERHIETERKLNLRALLDKSSASPGRLEDARALLAPFLRDTLVGFNYAYYAPPGAELLLTNPVFVRSHDFVGLQGSSSLWRSTEVQGNGWPASAGGRLVGSLAGLPYALAEAEENFLVPTREQALIWSDLVPQILLGATVSRWWHVTPAQMHWVALHMQYSEALYAEAALNPTRRAQVLAVLARHAPPNGVSLVQSALESGNVREAVDETMPAELFFVAQDLAAQDSSRSEPLAAEIRREAAESPNDLNYPAISHAFGTPKPTLANSYEPQLLYLRTFPALMGYSSRILAESWESSLLYYAELADDLHVAPAQLNVLVPAWTRATVEHIFATHLEDWPALLRSLRLVGAEAMARKNATQPVSGGL